MEVSPCTLLIGHYNYYSIVLLFFLDAPRSVVFDGKFLYTTSSNGQELMKLGTGINGTLRLVLCYYL